MNRTILRKISRFALIAICAVTGYTLTGCTEEIPEENRFTFKGELISHHLENNPEKFSKFCEILKKASIGKKASGSILKTLSTYGSYTCFAPTNEAVDSFLLEQSLIPGSGIESPYVEDISQAAATTIAMNHIIEMGYKTIDISEGVFPQATMSRRAVPVTWTEGVNGVSIILNNKSRIIEQDIETENGFIQVIDKVLNPSTKKLAEQIAMHPELSLFAEAIYKTGLDSLLGIHEIDPDYDGLQFGPITITREGEAPYPDEKHQRYTVLVETNETFANPDNNAGSPITNIDELIEFAQKFYGTEAADDFTNPKNALHQFVAYHIIDRQLHYSSSTGPGGFIMENYNSNKGFKSELNMPTTHDRYDYFETALKHTMIKVTRPFTNDEYKQDVVINYAQDNGTRCSNPAMEKHINVVVLRVNDANIKEFDQNSVNGTIHAINKILVYNKKEMSSNILNERMRWDISSLFPEYTNNGVRWAPSDKYNITYIPNDYSSRFVVNSPDCNVYYLRPHKTQLNGYATYQGDELLVTGRYDFKYRIPYVPEGDYEIRFGFSQSDLRGVCQFYFNEKICGIPVDMREGETTRAIVGWFDESTMNEDEILANDKAMRNRGYMKGPASCVLTDNNENMRLSIKALRKIVGTFHIDGESDYWLRFKNVTENMSGDQFSQDYLEVVPTTIITNPRKPEDQY